jgi:hypothetical protein
MTDAPTLRRCHRPVTPAYAGVHGGPTPCPWRAWIPAYAGMTGWIAGVTGWIAEVNDGLDRGNDGLDRRSDGIRLPFKALSTYLYAD